MKQLLIGLGLIFILAVPTLAKEASPAARQEEARVRVQAIRDENKQRIAEYINKQLEHIKTQATKHFNNILERMGKLLEKIKTRAPAVDITAAQAAIDTAQAAIDDLKDNVYLIEFTAESDLRVGASTAKTQLRADIKAVHEKIRLARQAVVDTLEAAKAL